MIRITGWRSRYEEHETEGGRSLLGVWRFLSRIKLRKLTSDPRYDSYKYLQSKCFRSFSYLLLIVMTLLLYCLRQVSDQLHAEESADRGFRHVVTHLDLRELCECRTSAAAKTPHAGHTRHAKHITATGGSVIITGADVCEGYSGFFRWFLLGGSFIKKFFFSTTH